MRRAELHSAVDLLALHRQHPRRFPFLLQSVAGHPQSGRWDLLFAFPQEELRLDASGLSASRPELAQGGDFFAALDRWCAREPRGDGGELPFCGGWFLYLGYEAARHVEPTLTLPPSPFALPDALAVRCPAAIVHDREQDRCYAIVEDDAAQLAELIALAEGATPSGPSAPVTAVVADEEDATRYLDGVTRVLDYLRAGDVFQVNLSRRWDVRVDARLNAADLYASLRERNPAPFAGLMRWGDLAVLSSSPERLLSIDARRAQTRPIAGTRRRSADAAEDAALKTVLRENLKERAEHVMLLDLERNDLGRVCVPGTVEVDELMTLESYAHVHHIVSNVRGRLRDGVGPGEALRAVFPGGTITGCPKVRVMQVIAELEGEGRGPYTGAFGYLSRDGRFDSNILIRTMVWQRGQVAFRAGAGIVADSQPQAELAETRAKARGLLLALGADA